MTSRYLPLAALLGALLLSAGCARGLHSRQDPAPFPAQPVELRRLPPLDAETGDGQSPAPRRASPVALDDWGPADWQSVKNVSIRLQ